MNAAPAAGPDAVRPVAAGGRSGPLTSLLVLEMDGRAVDVDDAWRETTGLSRAGSTGHGWLVAVETDRRERLLEAVRLTACGRLTACVVDAALAGRASRWRLSSLGGRVVALVGPGAVPTPVAGAAVEGDRTAVLAQWLLPDLFALSLDLAACAGALDEPWRRRVSRSLDRLDDIIGGVRAADATETWGLADRRPGAGRATDLRCGPPG